MIKKRRPQPYVDEIDDAIRYWAEQYNDEFLARMKGDDAISYRLRAELKSRIVAAIERTKTAKTSN